MRSARQCRVQYIFLAPSSCNILSRRLGQLCHEPAGGGEINNDHGYRQSIELGNTHKRLHSLGEIDVAPVRRPGGKANALD